jgi:hypothetical protein
MQYDLAREVLMFSTNMSKGVQGREAGASRLAERGSGPVRETVFTAGTPGWLVRRWREGQTRFVDRIIVRGTVSPDKTVPLFRATGIANAGAWSAAGSRSL